CRAARKRFASDLDLGHSPVSLAGGVVETFDGNEPALRPLARARPSAPPRSLGELAGARRRLSLLVESALLVCFPASARERGVGLRCLGCGHAARRAPGVCRSID